MTLLIYYKILKIDELFFDVSAIIFVFLYTHMNCDENAPGTLDIHLFIYYFGFTVFVDKI